MNRQWTIRAVGGMRMATLLACAWLAAGPVGAGEPPDPLAELNQAFRAAYAHARQEALARAGPVIVVEGDNLVLLHKGKRSEVLFMPERYHTLKAVAHVPLAVYVMVAPYGEEEIPEKGLAGLRAYRRQVASVRDVLEKRGLTAEELKRQQQILDMSLELLDRLLRTRQARAEEWQQSIRRFAPLVQANAADAARAQIDALHTQVQAWRSELPADEWSRLRVLIMGSALPRKGNLSVQYFARLLGEAGEGNRIIYAESLFEEGKALNLLGTHLLDTAIGAAFFDNPRRMHRDLLADAAEEYLKTLKLEPAK
jgi:hypothetical protein